MMMSWKKSEICQKTLTICNIKRNLFFSALWTNWSSNRLCERKRNAWNERMDFDVQSQSDFLGRPFGPRMNDKKVNKQKNQYKDISETMNTAWPAGVCVLLNDKNAHFLKSTAPVGQWTDNDQHYNTYAIIVCKLAKRIANNKIYLNDRTKANQTELNRPISFQFP